MLSLLFVWLFARYIFLNKCIGIFFSDLVGFSLALSTYGAIVILSLDIDGNKYST